jgi:hypothetical protein
MCFSLRLSAGKRHSEKEIRGYEIMKSCDSIDRHNLVEAGSSERMKLSPNEMASGQDLPHSAWEKLKSFKVLHRWW